VAAPTAREILAQVRAQQTRQNAELEGQLRENERMIPFRLVLAGPLIRYSFANPDETLQLRLSENDSQLELVKNDGTEQISGAEFGQKVRGTAITYEDLALRFIYWPNAQVVGEDYINTRHAWKLELKPPGRQSQYSRAFLWCDQESGALLRLEVFDWNGKLTKRFAVISVQSIEGRTFLKQLRIESMQPETGKATALTYLDIKKK
jgi:hypothetical protein